MAKAVGSDTRVLNWIGALHTQEEAPSAGGRETKRQGEREAKSEGEREREARRQGDFGPEAAREEGSEGESSEGGLSDIELDHEAEWSLDDVNDFLITAATDVKKPKSKKRNFQARGGSAWKVACG